MKLSTSSQGRLAGIYPDLRVRGIRMINDVFLLHGWQLEVSQGLRTYDDQLAIWKLGRELLADGTWAIADESAIRTWAEPGDSWHHFSAFDVCFGGKDPYLEALRKADADKWEYQWSEVARLGHAHGLEAGYFWPGKKKDRPHFQLRYGLTLARVKDLYKQGGLDAVWKCFDTIRGVPLGSEWRK